MSVTSFETYVMSVQRVEQRLRKVTGALDAAGIPYAVVGGNAVAAWVSRADPAATRATKDVNLLVDQHDLPRITETLRALGFTREEILGVVLFVDPDEPSVRSGVQLIWAGELVRPEHIASAPPLTEIVRDAQGFAVIDLPALVRMKLVANRRIDQVHIEDMLRVGLIDERVRGGLSPDLTERLHAIEQTMD